MKPIQYSLLFLRLFARGLPALALLIPGLPAAQDSSHQTSKVRYEIRVELDDENKMLHGREHITWRNESRDSIRDMWFHLYYNAFKNEKSTLFQEAKNEGMFGLRVREGDWGWIDVLSIRLADGRDLKPSMEFVTLDAPMQAEDQTVMRVLLPEPLEPDREINLEIEFQSKIPRTALRSGYYKNSYFIAQWFPKPGVYEEGRGWNCHAYHLNSEFFADFADFKVHITVPSHFVLGASGKQVSAVTDQEKKTVTYTFVQDRIHDFAWTADSRFIKIERDFIAAERVTSAEFEETARRLGLPLEEVVLPDVKMILLIRSEHRRQADRHFRALEEAIKYYGLWYGPYPYETVTMVDPPFRTGSGGMEYPTLFTAGTSLLRSRKVLSPEQVIVHEFGHGYWYGLVANNEFEEAWLDEGINTYSTGKVLAQAYGPSELPLSLKGIPLNWFFRLPEYFDHELNRALAVHVVKLDPVTTYSWEFYNRMSYGSNVYMRASTLLESLERLVGEDAMLRILRTFQMRFRYNHPKTQDFIDVVNEVTGKDFTWFFEELFFNTLEFDYSVASLRSYKKPRHFLGVFDRNAEKIEITRKDVKKLKKKKEETGEKVLHITEVRVRRFGEARPRGGVKLRVCFDDGSEETRFWDGQERWKEFTFVTSAKAVSAWIDPDKIWLIDSNLANNSLKIEPAKGGVSRLVARLLFWVQNYLQLLSALS